MLRGKVLVGALLAASTALGAPTTGKATGEVSQISMDKDSPQVISDFDHFWIHTRNEGELQKPRPKAESKGNAETGDDNTKDRTNDQTDDKMDDKRNSNLKDRTTSKADDKMEDKQNNNPNYLTLDTLKDIVKDMAAAKMDDKTNNATNGTANDVQNINLNNATLATLNDVIKHMSQDKVNATMDDKTNNTTKDSANSGQNSDADYTMVDTLTDLIKQMSKKTNNTTDGKAKDKKGSKADYDEELVKKVKQMSTDMMMDMVKKKLDEAQGRINGLPKNHPDNRPANYMPNENLGTGVKRNLTELLFNRPLTYSEYTARNWMWLRCRTFTSNQFDVGGNWPGHFGSDFLRKLRETKCAPMNWQFEYANGQRWGDAYVVFDWWSTGCDQIRAVKAAIRTATKSALEMRRELYIYNCVGFNDYPWSFVEMRHGKPEMMDHNNGLGMDPAATAQQKWFNGEEVPGFDPIAPNAEDAKAKEEEEEEKKKEDAANDLAEANRKASAFDDDPW